MATVCAHVLVFLSFVGLEADALAGTRSAALADSEQRQVPCVNSVNCTPGVVVSSPANPTLLNDSSASPFAAGWAPTEEEDDYLLAQAQVAEENRVAVQEKHKQLLTSASIAQKEFEDAARVEAIAKKKSSIADEAIEAEEKRIRGLPVLVKMAQQAALAQHAKRMLLEEEVKVARETHNQTRQIQEDGLKAVEREINKQRLVDRIRAAEDARIANAATVAAEEAAREKEVKDADIAAVTRTAETANEESQIAITGANRIIMDATMTMTKEVMEATSSAAMIDVRLAEAKSNLDELRARAESSAQLAQESKQQAYLDRARADATSLGAGAIGTFAETAQGQALQGSNTAKALNDQAMAATTQAESASQALADAKSAASTSDSAATAALTNTSMAVGESAAEAAQSLLLARTEPERYLAGFVNGFVDNLNGL